MPTLNASNGKTQSNREPADKIAPCRSGRQFTDGVPLWASGGRLPVRSVVECRHSRERSFRAGVLHVLHGMHNGRAARLKRGKGAFGLAKGEAADIVSPSLALLRKCLDIDGRSGAFGNTSAGDERLSHRDCLAINSPRSSTDRTLVS